MDAGPSISIPLNLTLFLIGQTIVIGGAVLGAYLGLSRKVSEVSIHVHHLTNNAAADRTNHATLRDQVQGISRTVERHDAVIQMHTVRSVKAAENAAHAAQAAASAAHPGRPSDQI